MPPKPDLVYPSLDDFVDKSVSESEVEKPTVESNEPNTVRNENRAPIIKDWVSEIEEEGEPKFQTVKPNFTKIEFVKPKPNRKLVEQIRQDTYRSPRRNWNQQMPINNRTISKNCKINQKVNTVRAKHFNTARPKVNTARPKSVLNDVQENHVNAVKASSCLVWRPKHKVLDHVSRNNGASMSFKRFDYGKPQQDLKDKGMIDSGCSRHMTRSKSYITNYEEIDGGFVAFGGNSKGGKITRKCKIRTGKLDFEDVYFEKELNFNFFSVSQICDKKNNVLFTDTACVVLSPDFKLTDESHVFLKVPRKDNMYSVDLKNVIPKGEQFWTTTKAKNINGEAQIHAKVDGKKVNISKTSIRRDLRFGDEEGVDCFSNKVIFEQLTLMGPVQVFLNNQLEGMDNHIRTCGIPSHTKKVFGNMRRVGKDFSGKITSLFPTTMMQTQEEIETQVYENQRKDTELPQTSVPTGHVADEAINEEMDDSLKRATTTATSLDAEQDRGNISKTQSKATPNEPSSPRTSSGDGPRRQDTMGDTIYHTRSENVFKFSNNPLLAGVNTFQRREDSLKLTELMELCTNLQQRVFDFKTTKTSQAQKITSLKKRVKRLENKRRSRTHGLKRLYKVGLSARLESSADEESLGEEDAFKQGRISIIDANQDIYLVNVHRDEDIFGVNDQDDTSMFDADKDLQSEEVVVEEFNAASIATTVIAATTTVVSFDELTLAQALVKIKNSKPKAKGIVMQEPNEAATTTTIIPPIKPQDKGKGIMVEPEIPLKKKAQISLDEDLAFKIQAEEKEQERIVREKAQQIKEEFLEKIRKFFAAKRNKEMRNRPLTKAQQRSVMSTYMKNMDGRKRRALKNKSFTEIKELVNKAMARINNFVDFRTELVDESTKKDKA
nr:ribonuclease H-like domain-containing protein [Tanacetum cinerariifolium]